MKRIGILTGGGDCPGLNAVIRAAVRTLIRDYDIEVVGIQLGFEGLLTRSIVPLGLEQIRGILPKGGTLLRTTNRGNPFEYPTAGGGAEDRSGQCIDNIHDLGIDGIIAIGGDGTLKIAQRLCEKGIPIVAVPKTIDNDLAATDYTFGFHTAVAVATDAVDRLHTTAESHDRVMILEVMGRNAGWIALYAGIAGGADVALIPEIPFDLDKVVARLEERERLGARFSVVVVAEGAFPAGGTHVIVKAGSPDKVERLGGIGERIAIELEHMAKKETRYVVLGHLQRGGTPSAYDRVLATRFGSFAVDLLKDGTFGVMTALKSPDIVAVPLECVVGRARKVPVDGDVVKTARNVGIAFGD